jgi:uncharacterized LabA/DUF88 family protein
MSSEPSRVTMTSNSFATRRRTMMFIDGGHLINLLHELKLNPKVVDYGRLAESLMLSMDSKFVFLELIRVYYYDATFKELVDDKEQLGKYQTQQEIMKKLRETDFFEIREKEIVSTSSGSFRQSGVDSMIAIDMLSKAYKDQYDAAFLIAGDDDFLDVITNVKNAGKIVYGAYVKKHISEQLRLQFDRKVEISQQFLITNRIIL